MTGGSCADGVGRLQGIAPLNPTVALTTLADVDVELAVNGLARDLHLELLSEVSFVQRSAAVGAAVGQGRLVNLVDLFGSGRLVMGLDAEVLSWLASGLLGVWLGLALSEGSGLALAGTGRLVELAVEALDLGFQVVDLSPKRLAVGTPNRLHTGIIRSIGTYSCTDGRCGIAQLEVEALIKYRLQSTSRHPCLRG
jgi:hypothetical protein